MPPADPGDASQPARGAVVLIGPMGAGKTSIGRRAARALGREFVDTDKILAREHGPIPDLFETLGEPGFRELERAAVAEALTSGGVVALGGGAVLDPATREDLRAHRVVLLTVSPHVVAGRIHGTDRPLLSDPDPVARWRRIYAARRDLYRDCADVTFDTSTGPLSAVVDAVVDWVARSETPTAQEQA